MAARISQRGSSGADFIAAVRACGVGSPGGPSFAEVMLPPRTLVQYLDAWSACIAKNGYKLPTPNTTGQGPVFPIVTERISKYRAAATHCVSTEPAQISTIALAARS